MRKLYLLVLIFFFVFGCTSQDNVINPVDDESPNETELWIKVSANDYIKLYYLDHGNYSYSIRIYKNKLD